MHRTIRSALALFGACALALTALAARADTVGEVMFARGDVVAIGADQRVRPLARGAAVHEGDTLRTAAGALVQIRFRDDTMLSLRERTEFRVDQHRHDTKNPEHSISLATLLRGGYRTLTGAIARLRPGSYKVNTPVAIIGVRGTNYEAVLGKGANDGLYVGAWQGTVVLENNSGVTLLGEGAPYNFAHVLNVNTLPQGMMQPPPVMHGGPRFDPAPQHFKPENMPGSTAPPPGDRDQTIPPPTGVEPMPPPNINLDPNINLAPLPGTTQ